MTMRIPGNRKRFSDLTEREILALAISSEEDDARIYRNWAEFLRTDYPATAAIFDGMGDEEDDHRARLIEGYRARFGEAIPVIRREHVAGYYSRRPAWMMQNLSLDTIRREAALMEHDAADFYARAAQARIVAEVEAVLSGPLDGDVLLVGHGAVGTLLWCALMGKPISRAHDQLPGGGCWYGFPLDGRVPETGWQAMERFYSH